MKDIIEAEIKNLLTRRQGRAFLAWLMFDVAGMLRSTFATNALINAHREGERNVGLRLHAEAERIHPEGLMEMYKEFVENGRRSQHPGNGNRGSDGD